MPWLLVGLQQRVEALWLKEKPTSSRLIEQRRANLAGATR